MTLENIANNWVQSQDPDIRDEAKEIINHIINYEVSSAGDLAELDYALNDESYDFDPPLPPELIAKRISNWTNNEIPIDHPLVKNHKKYRDLVLDMDYEIDDPNKMEEIRDFGMLLAKSAPDFKKDILSTINNIVGLSTDDSKIENAYIVDGMIVGELPDDNFIFIDPNENEVRTYSKDGARVNVNRKNITSNLNRTQKRVINKEELYKIIGDKLYNSLYGDDISIFDLPD